MISVGYTCIYSKSPHKSTSRNGTTLKSKINQKNTIGFKGKPWELPYIPVHNGTDAITLYNYLKIGNYLDSADDDVSFDNKKIRNNNLGFLNAIQTENDKKIFIDNYRNLTGFPDLEQVSINIENEFTNAIKKSSQSVRGGECIAAGYDETCSVGKRKAFPGSDLDKSFIILKGGNSPEEDKKIVTEFKGQMWNNVDQRILSFNHDISFPTIYTINQIKNNLDKIDKKVEKITFDKEELNKIMDEEYIDLEKASKFNILLSYEFPVDDDTKENLTKSDVKNFGYFIEPVRDGKYLISTPEFEDLKNEIKDSPFYQYSNIAQTNAMKKAVNEGRENKTKILLRENMQDKFNSWNIDKQYDFIKTLVKYSCEDDTEYSEYFKNDRNVKDSYKPVLNILTCGDKNKYNRPEFHTDNMKLCMKYSDDSIVALYKGYSDNVLWVDSNKSEAIKQVCRHIDKIKECELFKNIDKIQCERPDEYIKGFYPIQYKTKNDTMIYEKDLKNES